MNSKLNLKTNSSSLLETSHLKPLLYNSVLSIAQYIALHNLRSLENNIEPVDKKKIIIHSVHGTYLSAIYKEGALAKALRLYGHDAKMLFCNKRISCCCALFTLDHPSSKRDCKNCVSFGRDFCLSLNIPRLTYQDFSVPEDRLEQFLSVGNIYPEGKHKGVHIGRHAETGSKRYFKGDPVSKEIYHKHFISKLLDASIVVDVAEQVLEKEKPDIIVTSHSCYSEFGPFSEFFKNAGIPVFTWFTGYEPNTLVFDLPEVGKNFKKYLEKNGASHSGSELIELETFMSKRRSGMGESKLYGFTSSNEELGLSKDRTIFGLFPNSPWDADPSCATLFFDSIQAWVEETIQFFINHQNYFLIVKTHPSEKLYHSRTTVYDLIKTKFPTLPENILLLPPDTSISAYELFKNLNVGIVSNTTTGLEMMLDGVPVVTVGDAHYRNKGFTYDPKTKKEYFDLLERGFFTLFNKEKMEKYAYYYFIKSFLPYHVFHKKNFLNIGFTFKSLEELKNNQEMSHIIECITEGKLFQEW